MDIIQEIQNKLIEYQNEPTKIYMGNKQYYDLVSYTNFLSKYCETKTIKGCDRPEVQGLKIYRVNSEDHLEVR